MKRSLILVIFAFLLGVAGSLLFVPASNVAVRPAMASGSASNDNLTTYMALFQHIAHKIGLSIDAGNKDLASFYVGELNEESGIVAKRFPQYQGIAVGALLPAMLNPYIAPLKSAVDAGNMPAASTAYDNLITGCNACHAATQHSFVKIKRVKTNPYLQEF